MELVNLGIAGVALVVCALCARHGIVQYVKWKSPDSRHFMQCAVAFIVGSVFAAIELGAIHYEVMTPLLRLILGGIRNGILLIIIYHGVANLCIELVFKEGKMAQKQAMRRQLFWGWVCLSAVSIPYCLGRGMRFYWVYSGVRFLLFIWYIFPTVLWYHRESLVAPNRVVGCRLNYLKRANFLGMLHPLAAFVTKVTACPLSLHLVLGLVKRARL